MTNALWFTGPRKAELRQEAIGSPAAGEILVQSICSLVSAGSELNLYRGEGNLPGLDLLPTAEGTIPFPVKFGYQQVGEVVEAGPGTRFAPGDRVMCLYPHQDRFVMPEVFATPIADGLPAERAAFGANFTTAWNAVATTPPTVGDCLAVSGLGIIGSFVASMVRRTATTLILIDPSPERRQRASWIGADHVIDPAEADEIIGSATGGRGVDLFYEASGAPSALQSAIWTTAVEGTITALSWYGTRPVELSLSPEFHLKRHRIVSTGPTMPPLLAPRWDNDRMYGVAWDYLAEVPADELLISHSVPFSTAPKAYELLDSGAADVMAVLIDHRS